MQDNNRRIQLGKYILESISVGLYNDPLMVVREYIQNCTDSIDDLRKNTESGRPPSIINIVLDGREKTITIRDNGVGVAASQAWSALHDLGESKKISTQHRGFRGIGRLGGLGYCDMLEFTTKARGDGKYSKSMWDCDKLRRDITTIRYGLSISRLLRKNVDFTQQVYKGSRDDHFFQVRMLGVHSIKDMLLSVPDIKKYISQVAPVPFNSTAFRFGVKIDKELQEMVPSYATYDIRVNGERVFKPYKTDVSISKGTNDTIKGIRFVEFKDSKGLLAVGWLGQLQLYGRINPSQGIDGIRVRSGNILVGSKSLLADYFRERRFNSYLVGELYVIDKGLVLNSRRDDFEDNQRKSAFYNTFIKEIGLPFSRKIRRMSAMRSHAAGESKQVHVIDCAKYIVHRGYIALQQKKDNLRRLKNLLKNADGNRDHIRALIKNVRISPHYLDRNGDGLSKKTKIFMKSCFEYIYQCTRSEKQTVAIAKKILRSAKKLTK